MSSDGNLRPLFQANVAKPCHWQSIETAMTGAGVPDSNYCIPPDREGWIEFKQTEGHAVTLRPGQIGWLLARERHGGRTFIAVRRRRDPIDELWLFRGSAARELKLFGLRGVLQQRLQAGQFLGRWEDGPSRWDWDAVRQCLVQ